MPSGGNGLAIYTVRLDAAALGALRTEGVDFHEVEVQDTEGHELAPAGTAPARAPETTVVLSADQAGRLSAAGLVIGARASTTAATGDGVFRPYSGDGGLADELEQLAADHPGLTELVTIGRSVQGKDIVALKLTHRTRCSLAG